MRPRFQADADLNQTIVLAVLRQEAEEILLIWSVTSPEEWRNRLVYLPL